MSEELWAGTTVVQGVGILGDGVIDRGTLSRAKEKVMFHLSQVGLMVTGDPVIRWEDDGVILKWRVASVPGLEGK